MRWLTLEVDDDEYSAMSGLLGEPVGSIKTPMSLAQFSQTPITISTYLKGSSAQDCFISTQYGCFHENDEIRWRLSCGVGLRGVGVAHGTNVPHKTVCPVSEMTPQN
jgi:hypothetical protein